MVYDIIKMDIKKDFETIKNNYDEFYNNFNKKNSKKLLIRSTKDGFFGYAILDEVFDLFKKIKLNNYKNFIDLGSGDGRVVLTASLFTNAKGLETDEKLFELSKRFNESSSAGNASFELKDFMQIDLSEYDAIFINPDKPFYRNHLEAKLLKEMKKDALLIVYGNHFLPSELNLKKKILAGGDVGTDVFVYGV